MSSSVKSSSNDEGKTVLGGSLQHARDDVDLFSSTSSSSTIVHQRSRYLAAVMVALLLTMVAATLVLRRVATTAHERVDGVKPHVTPQIDVQATGVDPALGHGPVIPPSPPFPISSLPSLAADRKQHRKNVLVGGWSDIDLSSPSSLQRLAPVLKVIHYVLNHFASTTTNATSSSSLPVRFELGPIRRARQQVVAGVNYEIEVSVTKRVGPPSRTSNVVVAPVTADERFVVWDRFGTTMTVSQSSIPLVDLPRVLSGDTLRDALAATE